MTARVKCQVRSQADLPVPPSSNSSTLALTQEIEGRVQGKTQLTKEKSRQISDQVAQTFGHQCWAWHHALATRGQSSRACFPHGGRTGFAVQHHLWVPTFQLWFPSPSLAEVDLKGSDPWDLSGAAIRSAPGKCPLERPRAPGRSSWVMTPVGGQPSGSGHSPTHLCHTCAQLFPERMSSESLLLLVVSY